MAKTALRRERERRGWSRGYIAERVEVDVITVGRWERGERLPHPHYRQQLCALFEMNAEELGLLPELYQKPDESAHHASPPDNSGAATVTKPSAIATTAVEEKETIGETVPQETPVAVVARTGDGRFRRRRLLLGLSGLGVACLAGGGLLYARRLSATSAGVRTTPALSLSPSPGEQLFDPTSFTNWVNRLAWSPDSSRIAVANGVNKVSIWNLAQSTVQLTYPTLNQWVNDISWSQSGWLAAANAEKNSSIQGAGSVQVWKYPEARLIWSLPCAYALRTAAWSPNEKLLALAGHAQTVEVWNPFAGTRVSQYQYARLNAQQGISRVRWSADGSLLACAADDGSVHIWEPLMSKPRMVYHEHKLRVVDLSWSPDGQYIASGSEDHTVRVWHALSGKTLLVYRGHSANVEAVDWSPQNAYLASGGSDSSVQIWEAHTGRLRMTYKLPGDAIEALLWSRNGTKLAAGTDKQGLTIW